MVTRRFDTSAPMGPKPKAARRSRKAIVAEASDAETIVGDTKIFGVGVVDAATKGTLHKFFQAELATPSTALPSIDASELDDVGPDEGRVDECVPTPACDGNWHAEGRNDTPAEGRYDAVQSPREADVTRARLCEAVVSGDIHDLAHSIVGETLTEQNFDRFTDVLAAVAKTQESRSPESAVPKDNHGSELSKHEARRLELLEKIIAENNFPGKSPMGNLFREKLKADSVERAKYEALDTAAEQLAFRLSWCKAEAASLTARRDRSKTTTWARRDLARFRYKPFGAMVVEWGGWGCADALKGATAAAAKCVSMGPPWAKLHPQSGLMEYAVVEQCWEEEYAVCWQETQNELLGTVQVDAVADDNTRGVDTAVDGGHAEAPSAPADVAHATGAPSSRAKTKATSPKPPMAKKAKREAVDDAETTLAGLFKEASRVRTMFVQATTAAEELSSMIRSGGDYKWAVNNVAGGLKLSRLMSELRGSVSEFAQHFIVSDVKTVKASYTSARLEHELQGFISMTDKITAINKTVKQILNATTAMQSE